jgi:Domain of unknown function (DUF4345)
MSSSGGGRSGLQALLAVMGTVMVVAGAATVVLGAASVPGVDVAAPDVDSEMRFYAVWYVVAGVAVLRVVRDVESATTTVRLVAAGFFTAGCARILSWVVVGRPHAIAIVLMVLELVLPIVIVPWQAALARRSRSHDATA